MANSSKVTINGTRNPDTIVVGATGVTLNTVFTPYTPHQIDNGFILRGKAGDDTITGGRGPDDLYGGDGNDILRDAWNGAYFDGGRGIDLLDLGAEPANNHIGVDLLGGSIFLTVHQGLDADGFLIGNSTAVLGSNLAGRVTGIENLTTGSGNDLLLGTNGANVLDGGAGNDIFNGRAGNDTIFGRAGSDFINGGPGTDSLRGGADNDLFQFHFFTDSRAGDGIDTIMDFTSVDRIDLKDIDSNPSLGGIQEWEFIGSSPPTAPSLGGNGQATLTYDGTKTVLNLYANDGDFNADFTLNIIGAHTYDPWNMVGIVDLI